MSGIVIALEKSRHLIGVASRAGVPGTRVIDLAKHLGRLSQEEQDHFLAIFTEAANDERVRVANRQARSRSRR